LGIEKDRSEALLLNILPAEIAEELKEKGSVNAQEFDLASILFTDFKSFTQTAEKMTPQSLVEEINICFKAFDLIAGKYHIEKIKTIGDAYMAAGGIPHPDENSTKNIVLAGLEMQEFVVKRAIENEQNEIPFFEMRLGIHAGPIVAGIVGVKKFQYDVWGDAVNTASRMESNGMVGKVNISETLYELIKDEECFTFEYRGHIHAKGKGEIKMYFVEKTNLLQEEPQLHFDELVIN
jgi:adenylate cyclase